MLDDIIRIHAEHPDVLGVALCGSYRAKLNDSASDLDIWVCLTDDRALTAASIDADLRVHDAAYYRERRAYVTQNFLSDGVLVNINM